MFARLKNVLSSHTTFRSLFRIKCGNQTKSAKASDATGETFHSCSLLPPSLDQCLEKISDLKSLSSRHYQIICSIVLCSHEVKILPYQSTPWHLRGEHLRVDDFPTTKNM